ncbi:MAG: hypothetical protein IJF57_05635 [Clostridia bacterium]|nr:hypothetical protein [Clostridia bacterium]
MKNKKPSRLGPYIRKLSQGGSCSKINSYDLNGIALAMPFCFMLLARFFRFFQESFRAGTCISMNDERNKKAVTRTASIGESIVLAFTNDVLCNGFEI